MAGGGTVSCQCHICANGCYKACPRWPSDLARHLTQPPFLDQTTQISTWPKVTAWSDFIVSSLLPCVFFHTLRDTPEFERLKMG